MKHPKRNIADPISPQNPVNKTDITSDRVQNHLDEKTSVEDIFKDENELTVHTEKEKKNQQPNTAGEISPEEEAGI